VSFLESAAGGPGAPAIPAFPYAQMAAILFTSGSTGEPVP